MPPRRGFNRQGNPFSSLFGNSGKSGGFLSSLFGGKKSQPSNFFGSRPSSQSKGISEIVENTQKMLSTMQKAAPIVKQARQYGPLIKNLPSMYRIMKAAGNNTETEKTDIVKVDVRDTKGKRKSEENHTFPKIFFPKE